MNAAPSLRGDVLYMEGIKTNIIRRMMSSGMLHHVALVRTDVSEEPRASFIRATRIGELGTMLAATSNRHKLRRNTKYFFTGISLQHASVASCS
jgi:hypothetical protein